MCDCHVVSSVTAFNEKHAKAAGRSTGPHSMLPGDQHRTATSTLAFPVFKSMSEMLAAG